ncbi:OLC1v1016268C1 [Oldenlandia corymbosa var. corymbosa]|uniref:OLC1v1016268C1 n=1 Tax=Oldenlandia corymbosa var. corymbosa TaxID=529605 RepID=A0AAV1E7D0_OLDCO|nr:OLC1v1016268C1 [Oldenlandia corymbosa var. corymbosa]
MTQLINVPEYSEDDLEEENEDEENEFDEDDVQDSVRMDAHHRDRPMYNPSIYPPLLFGCPQSGPGDLPSPPTPIPSPISGEWRSPHCSPSLPSVVQFSQGISTSSRSRPSRTSQASPPLIPCPLAEVPSPLEYLHVLPLSLISCALAEVPSPLEYLHVLLPLLYHRVPIIYI